MQTQVHINPQTLLLKICQVNNAPPTQYKNITAALVETRSCIRNTCCNKQQVGYVAAGYMCVIVRSLYLSCVELSQYTPCVRPSLSLQNTISTPINS